MSLEMKKAFLNAFAKLPVIDFLWKFTRSEEDDELFKQYPNVHTFKWVDQVSILAHPKTRVFITHSGMNSVNEASTHGVPMLTIPLFGDQLYNAAIVKKLGVGIHLNVLEISEATVYEALKTILEDSG
ncbi:CRE-UGT-62 protein [Aphelenchoides avenae]|nr:CRE-UGT-62 protein [Aphelenchus avenae]